MAVLMRAQVASMLLVSFQFCRRFKIETSMMYIVIENGDIA